MNAYFNQLIERMSHEEAYEVVAKYYGKEVWYIMMICGEYED